MKKKSKPGNVASVEEPAASQSAEDSAQEASALELKTDGGEDWVNPALAATENTPSHKELLLSTLHHSLDPELISIKLAIQDEVDIFATQRGSDPPVNGLLDRSNIICVGIGHKETAGRVTSEVAIVIGVLHKVEMRFIEPNARIPPRIWWRGKTYLTDVKQMRPVSPFACVSGQSRLQRPVTCGVSIGDAVVGEYGTLGCMAKLGTVPQTLVFITCNHVVARGNKNPVGTTISQPAKYDNGQYPADVIGSLKDFVYLKSVGVNFVDLAAVTTSYSYVKPYINCVNIPIGLYNSGLAPLMGMKVTKVGRSTNLTSGTVGMVGAATSVGSFAFDGLFVISNSPRVFAFGGDSGAIVMHTETPKYVNSPLGMVIGGDPDIAVATPMKYVMTSTFYNTKAKLLKILPNPE